MGEVSNMDRATIVAFRFGMVMLMLHFPILKKNFLSNLKFTKKIEKCVQIGFGIADYESVMRFL